MFKKGDKVVCACFGSGIVCGVSGESDDYPVEVAFGDAIDNEIYTLEGKLFEKGVICLFHAEGYKPPVGGKEPVRRPDLKVDAKVLVWDSGREGYKAKRHFSHWLGNQIFCFRKGTTSLSEEDTGTVNWDHYEVVEGEHV